MKKTAFLVALLCLAAISRSQTTSVGIGTNAPHPSAALDVSASNKGLLIPRVALTGSGDVTTIAAPAAGLMVYNTTTSATGISDTVHARSYYVYTGSKWQEILTPETSEWTYSPTGDYTYFRRALEYAGPYGSGHDTIVATKSGIGIGTRNVYSRLTLGVSFSGGNFLTFLAGGTQPLLNAPFLYNGNSGYTELSLNYDVTHTQTYVPVTRISPAGPTYFNTYIGNVGVGTSTPGAKLHVKDANAIFSPMIIEGCGTYANDAAAGANGLTSGMIYKTATGVLMIKN